MKYEVGGCVEEDILLRVVNVLLALAESMFEKNFWEILFNRKRQLLIINSPRIISEHEPKLSEFNNDYSIFKFKACKYIKQWR